MKKTLLLTALSVFFVSVITISCAEKKTTGEKIEDTVEQTEDALEDTADEVEDAVEDAADEVKDATN